MEYKCKLLEPDYKHECDVCGATPIVPQTGMCGPCTFGEAETVDGDWSAVVSELCDPKCGCKEIKE